MGREKKGGEVGSGRRVGREKEGKEGIEGERGRRRGEEGGVSYRSCAIQTSNLTVDYHPLQLSACP